MKRITSSLTGTIDCASPGGTTCSTNVGTVCERVVVPIGKKKRLAFSPSFSSPSGLPYWNLSVFSFFLFSAPLTPCFLLLFSQQPTFDTLPPQVGAQGKDNTVEGGVSKRASSSHLFCPPDPSRPSFVPDLSSGLELVDYTNQSANESTQTEQRLPTKKRRHDYLRR